MRVTILIVDDEPAVVELIRRMMEGLPVDMLEASDPEGAIALMRSRRPDLVVVEPHLVEGDGFRVVEAAGRGVGAPAVYLMSASWTEASRARARALGAAAIWDKPFDVSVFRLWLVGWVLRDLARKL
jgi:CheY-like chemotaxis protein